MKKRYLPTNLLKLALVLLYCFCMTVCSGQDQQQCGSEQVRLSDQCVDCNSVLYGCNRCSIVSDRSFLDYVATPALLCTQCDYGLYMLTFDTENPPDDQIAGANPLTLTMCLRKCEDFAYNYVSDPNTKRCEYCGPTCTQCSLQYGCSRCFGNKGRQHSDPRDYTKYLTDGGTTAIFPYTFNPRTEYGGPSSEFATCVDCADYDERCDDCSTTTFLPAKPAQRRRRLQGTTPTPSKSTDPTTASPNAGPTEDPTPLPAAPLVPPERQCKSCFGYIEAVTQPATTEAAGFCTLTSTFGSENPNDPNCLQPQPENPAECLACKNGFYIESGYCQECSGEQASDTGCERCSASSCLECREGFNLKTVNGTGSCQPCDLSTEKDKYSLFKDRASQCGASLTSTKYCSLGFLNSQNGDFPELLFLNETFSEPLSAATTCNMKCGTAQFPVVKYETLNQNANMIKQNGKYCEECALDQCVKCIGTDAERDCQECWPGWWTALVDHKSRSGKCLQKFTFEGVPPPSVDDLELEEGETATSSEEVIVEDQTLNKKEPLQIEKTIAKIQGNNTFKLQYFNIYVSNKIDESPKEGEGKAVGKQRTGTYKDPFAQLTDALVRAKEMVAPFKDSVEITIHLYRGDHFLVENRFDALNIYTAKEAKDDFSLNLDLTIKPLACDHILYDGSVLDLDHCTGTNGVVGKKVVPVTVYNKIRERFQMEVLQRLRVENVIFDSVDSILPFGTPCLSEHRRCCMVTGLAVESYNPAKEEECESHFNALQLSDQCQVGHPNSLFVFINSHDRSRYPSFRTNRLELDKAQIRNFFYPMNSMLKVARYGAQIQITDSKFSEINICGALIKNRYVHPVVPDLSDIGPEYLGVKARHLLSVITQNQIDAHEEHHKYYYDDPKDTHIYPDNKIEIRYSEFANLNYKSTVIKTPTMVSEESGMQQHGLVLTLDDFPGSIELVGNTFHNNTFNFEACELLSFDKKTGYPLDIQPANTANNFDTTQRRSNTSSFDKVQVKSLISVQNHSHPLALAGNTFRQNNGLKGIINLEVAADSRTGVLIWGNRFERNSALFESNVLNMRKRANNVQRTNYTTAQHLECGGFEISQNIFQQNAGCKGTQGAISIYCFDAAFNQTAQIRYVNSTDSQYYIGSMYNESLLSSKPHDISGAWSTYGSRGGPNYDAVTSYPLNASDFWVSDHSPQFLGTDRDLAKPPRIRRVNRYRVILEGNTYLQNFAGAQRSIVQVEGFPLVESRNEAYKDNENWFQSAMGKFMTNGATQINMTETEPLRYNSTELAAYPYKSQSMLTIKRALRFELDGTKFINNYVVDDTDPFVYDDWHHTQSHGLLLIDFVGQLVLRRGATFEDNRGIQTGKHMTSKLSQDYYQRGFKNRLIQLDRYKFSKFIIDGLKFKGNEAYNYTKTEFSWAFAELKPGQGLETGDAEDEFHALADRLVAEQGAEAKNPPITPDPRPLLNMRPRLFSFSVSDFGNQSAFTYDPEQPTDSLDGFLEIQKVEITRNVFKNADFMLHLPAVNLTYGELVIQDNDQRLASNTSRLVQQPQDYDVLEAVVLFDLTADHTIRLSNATVRNNTLEGATVLKFREVFTKSQPNVHTQLNIEIFNQSSFSNNTSFHAPTSSVFIADRTPWLWIRFENTTFENNVGRKTNEYYAKQIKRLEVFNAVWSEKRLPRALSTPSTPSTETAHSDSKIDMRTTEDPYPASNGKLAEANADESWNRLAQTKFLLVDEYQYEVNITNSKFNCNLNFDQDIIFTQNQFGKEVEPSLFQFDVPANLTYLSHNDNAGDLRLYDKWGYKGSDRSNVFMKNLLCQELEDIDAIMADVQHPYHRKRFDATTMLYKCRYGMFYWQFQDNSYQNCNSAATGGIFQLSNGAKVNVTGSSTNSSENSAMKGGFAYLSGKDTELTVTDNVQLTAQRAYLGGAIYAVDRALVTIENTKLVENEAFDGIIYIQGGCVLNVTDTIFTQNLAHHRGMVSAHVKSYFNVTSTTFFQNEATYGSVIAYLDGAADDRLLVSDQIQKDRREMQFMNITHHHSAFQKSKIYQNTLIAGGNLVKVIGANFLLEDCDIHDNDLRKLHGGLHVSYGHLELNRNRFHSNRNKTYYYDVINDGVDASMQGGHLYIGTNSSVFSRDNLYMEARSFVGGCVAIVGFARASFYNDNFTRCAAEFGGAIYGSEFDSLSIVASSFSQNAVFGGKGENIFAERFYGTVVMERSNLTSFLNSVYVEQGGDLLVEDLTLVHGANLVHNPHELYDFEPIHAEDENHTIGAEELQPEDTEPLVLDANCTAVDPVTGVELDQSRGCRRAREAAEAERIRMESPDAIKKLLNSENHQAYSGGFYIKNMKKISKFHRVSMNGLRAEHGGCLHVQLDQNFREMRESYNHEPYRFSDLELYACLARHDGGAIFIKNIQNMEITGRATRIYKAHAFGSGGAINFECDKTDIGTCVLVLGNINITRNTAALNGGGIFWPHARPVFENTRMYDNQAGQYGHNNASYPVQIVKVLSVTDEFARVVVGKGAEDIYMNYVNTTGANAAEAISLENVELQTRRCQYPSPNHEANCTEYEAIWVKKTKARPAATARLFDDHYLIRSVQSGSFIVPQYLALVDENLQVCTNNRGSKIEIELSDPSTEIVGSRIFFSAYGVYNISGMEIYTTPGIQDIYMTARAEKSAIRTQTGKSYDIVFDLDVRGCILGESQTKVGQNFICKQCESLTYSLVTPQKGQIVRCKQCQEDESFCQGGSQIGPKPGYWRQSNITEKFLPCPNNASCVGAYTDMSDPGTYKATGNCAMGYYGALCSACIPAYYKNGNECIVCPDSQYDIIKSVFMFLCGSAFVTMLVKGTMVSPDGKQSKNTHSVFIKILMNHMIMIFITSSINMRWPAVVTLILKSLAFITELQQALVRFDCLFDKREWGGRTVEDFNRNATPNHTQMIDIFEDEAQLDNVLRITYQKIILVACLPIICGVIAISVWGAILLYQEKEHKRLDTSYNFHKDLHNKFISTLVILLFLVHPQLTQDMFNMFNCQTYDGVPRLQMDLQIECHVGKHRQFSMYLALPCIIIWSIGIPALIYFLLQKEKETLNTDASKIKFGFLYTGYKKAQFTWEIFIMYRKIICLVIAIFMAQAGIIVQALALILFMMVFVGLNTTLKPYSERSLNEIEEVSLLTQIVTIYCGLFFISNVDKTAAGYDATTSLSMSEDTKLVLFFVIVLSNVIFMVLWIVKFIITMKSKIKTDYENLYIIFFLCCRRDKLSLDSAVQAANAKRETIIEKIEDIEFFIGHMKQIYTKEIAYEGHSKFIQLLYFIENERKSIDLTVKRHNLYIQGDIARERKFDNDNIQEQVEQKPLAIHMDFGDPRDVDEEVDDGFERASEESRKNLVGPFERDEQRTQDDYEDQKFMKTGGLGKMMMRKDPMGLVSPPSMLSDDAIKPGAQNIALSMSRNFKEKFDQTNKTMGSDSKVHNATLRTNPEHEKTQSLMKKQDGDGLESEGSEEEKDIKKPKKSKKPTEANIADVIEKSRNYNRLVKKNKARVFAEDLDQPNRVRKYMLAWFPREETPPDTDQDDDSPQKQNPDFTQLDDGEDQSSQPQTESIKIDASQLGAPPQQKPAQNDKVPNQNLQTPRKQTAEKKFGQSPSPRSARSGTFKKSSARSRRSNNNLAVVDGTQSDSKSDRSGAGKSGRRASTASNRADTKEESSVEEENPDVMLARFRKPPRKFPSRAFFDDEKDVEARKEQRDVCRKIVSSLRSKTSIPEKTWAFRGYQIDEEEERGDQSDRAPKRRYYWYFSIGFQGKNLARFSEASQEEKQSWISFRESEEATDTKMGALEEICSIGEWQEDWVKAISPQHEDWDQIYRNSISLRWQGSWVQAQPIGPDTGEPITVEYMEVVLSRMRPQSHINYKMIVDPQDDNIKVVPVIKPIIKKKQVKFTQDPVTGAETESISDGSGKLQLSILESDNLEVIHLHYKMDDFQGAFHGEYSERSKMKEVTDKQQRKEMRKLKRQLKQEEKINSQLQQTEHRVQESQLEQTSKTFSQNIHGRMGIGSSDRNKSEMTGAMIMQGNFIGQNDFSHNLSGHDSHSRQGSEAQMMATLQNDNMRSLLFNDKFKKDIFISLSGKKEKEPLIETQNNKPKAARTPFANLKND